MTISGIIAEFNPFHNGHKYLLSQADGLKIVAMSGNFVQRGEPAFLDKWTRAQMALENGADLVVELPFLVSVQAADYFAAGAVDILAKLGIDQLVFGTETPLDYNTLGAVYQEKHQDMDQLIAGMSDALPYPQKVQAAWESLAGISFSADTPNHALALAYTKAASGKGIDLRPVQRLGQDFHSQDKTKQFASATAIRKHWQDQDFVQGAMPSSRILNTMAPVSWDDYFLVLKYQIMSHPDLTQIFQVNDEIANRLRQVVGEVSSVDELLTAVATKRYTKARLRRILTYILVNAQEASLPDAIHVLGFTAAGQAHLSQIKKQLSLVTRIGQGPWDALTQKADSIYGLGNSGIAEQNFGRVPIRVD